eukprot:118907-Rhodomonas_salina.2
MSPSAREENQTLLQLVTVSGISPPDLTLDHTSSKALDLPVRLLVSGQDSVMLLERLQWKGLGEEISCLLDGGNMKQLHDPILNELS